MDDVTTTRALIGSIRDAWRPWIDAIEGLDESQLVGPTDDAGWTVRDHIVHVTAWEATLTAGLTGQPRHEALRISEEDFAIPDIDVINEKVRAARSGGSGRIAVVHARVGHDVFMDVLASLPADAVLAPVSEFIPVRNEAAAGMPARDWIWEDSGGHYPMHLEYIRSILGKKPT